MNKFDSNNDWVRTMHTSQLLNWEGLDVETT